MNPLKTFVSFLYFPVLFALFVICLLLIPSTQVSASFIKVAIFDDISVAEVFSPKGILLKEKSGNPWRRYASKMTITISADSLLVDDRRLLNQRLILKGGEGKIKINDSWFEGTVTLFRNDESILVVNTLHLEDYLVGVLMGELPSAWPLEVLKVQAIASRTYALYQKGKQRYEHYDLVSTTLDQVYKGGASPDETLFEQHAREKIRQAVNATRGQFMSYNNKPILAAFHSTAAGTTEDALHVWAKDIPYLTGVACPWDHESKFFNWTRKISITTLEDKLRSYGYRIGTIASITPMTKTPSERVGSLRIIHSQGEHIIRGEEFRKMLGYTALLSTQFTIENFGRDVVFRGKGAGHGVGLCQWGAKELATAGFSADVILKYYYPGTEIKRM